MLLFIRFVVVAVVLMLKRVLSKTAEFRSVDSSLQREVTLQVILTRKRADVRSRWPIATKMVAHFVAEIGQRTDSGSRTFSLVAQTRQCAE